VAFCMLPPASGGRRKLGQRWNQSYAKQEGGSPSHQVKRSLAVPFGAFGLVCPPGCFHAGLYSSDWLLAQSRWLPTVSSALVGRSHFAVSRSLGCVVFPHEAPLVTVKFPARPSLEFRLRLESHQTQPSRPAAAGQHLPWAFAPYSTPRTEDPLIAGSPARYGPPSGFGYPLDGLRPSIPCRFCFTPAALLGFTLRSFLLAEGIRSITRRMAHISFCPPLFSSREAMSRSRQAAVSGR
jgi:hypothetical protein